MLVSNILLSVAFLIQQSIAETDTRGHSELEARNNGGSNITLQLPGHVNDSLPASAT